MVEKSENETPQPPWDAVIDALAAGESEADVFERFAVTPDLFEAEFARQVAARHVRTIDMALIQLYAELERLAGQLRGECASADETTARRMTVVTKLIQTLEGMKQAHEREAAGGPHDEQAELDRLREDLERRILGIAASCSPDEIRDWVGYPALKDAS